MVYLSAEEYLRVAAICAAHELLTRAHAAVDGPVVGVVTVLTVVGAGSIHEQALEMRKSRSPFWFSLQLFAAKDGMAVAATEAVVKVAQKDWALARRPGV